MATKSNSGIMRRESYSTPVMSTSGPERRRHSTPCKTRSICIDYKSILRVTIGDSVTEADNYGGAGGHHRSGCGGLSARDSGAEHLDAEARSSGLLNDLANGLSYKGGHGDTLGRSDDNRTFAVRKHGFRRSNRGGLLGRWRRR